MPRKLLLVLAITVAPGVFGSATASAQTDTTFCNAALDVDRAVANLQNGSPKRAAVDRAEVALAALEATAPPELTPDVATFVGTVRGALDDGDDPTSGSTFHDDAEAIGAYRYSSCGYQTADVTLLEYEFDGLPRSFAPGTVAIKLTNTGSEVHELALARLKTGESFRKTLARPEDDQGKRLRYVAQSLVEPDQTTYLFVDLSRAGRYGAACHIPVGTTSTGDLESGEDHGGHGGHGEDAEPHWREGMVTTFRVAA